MAIFGPKAWVNPFGKMLIFRLFELLVFIAQKGVFSFQNIIKDIFVAYIARKKKVGKMTIFGQKLSVNPFGKMSIFRLFFLLEHIKRHFPGLYCLKKKLEKWAFLEQNHGLTPFRLFGLLVFIAQKSVFRSRIL